MVGGFVGLAVGEAYDFRVTLAAVGASDITFAASGVGAATSAAAGTSTLTFALSGVGTGVVPSAGSSSLVFSLSGAGGSAFGAAGSSSLSFTVSGTAIILPIVSTKVIQKPVDVVLAGQQWKYRTGRATGKVLRGIFRE